MNRDNHLIFEAYALNGLAAGKTIDDIAKKHNVDIEALKAELDKGIKVEHEHTENEATARKIALDHLFENPHYYTKLAKVEDEEMPYPDFAKLSKHANSKLPEDKPKEKLKYTYEIVAYLPRDIDISTREGQDKVLSLAYKELVKRVTNKYKNPERAASNMFYDEDFPMELVSQYSRYQKHGFPDVEEDDYRDQMPDSREEYARDQEELSPAEIKRVKNNESYWLDMFSRTFGSGRQEEMLKNKIDPYEFFVDYYQWMRNTDPEIIAKFANLYNSKHPEHKVDVEKLLKMFSDIKDKPMVGYKAPSKGNEDEERRLDPKCWKGYHKEGTKLKGGVRVNNCVKNG